MIDLCIFEPSFIKICFFGMTYYVYIGLNKLIVVFFSVTYVYPSTLKDTFFTFPH